MRLTRTAGVVDEVETADRLDLDGTPVRLTENTFGADQDSVGIGANGTWLRSPLRSTLARGTQQRGRISGCSDEFAEWLAPAARDR